MWNALFSNWKNFNFYLFSKESPSFLEKFFNEKFWLESFKKSSSHRLFILRSSKEKNPLFLLKVFIPQIFKKNKVKKYLLILSKLEKMGIPVIKPIFLFWKNPQKAFFKKEPFYGGIVFPFLEEGFIKIENFFDNEKNSLNYEFLKSLVFFLFNLHEKGVYLRDTKYNNFYYFEENFRIFDLDDIKFYKKPLSKLERLKSLSTLAMSLEWQKIENARKLVFDFYKEFYSQIDEKDLEKFGELVDQKREKRQKTYFKNNFV